ncbi:hypothetical protein ACHQM5_026228 [Ranunculus cassubicifolius]
MEMPKSGQENVDITVDLGSTNTCVSVMMNNKPKIILKWKSGIALISKDIPEGPYDPKNHLPGVKHLMGRKFDDPFIQNEMKRVDYDIVEGPDGYAWVKNSANKLLSPSFLLGIYLRHIKASAEAYLGKKVSRAFATFPPDLTDDQIKDWMQAYLNAGFDSVEGINELTAAGIAYGLKKKGCVFAVINVGGRNLGISIFQVLSNQCFKSKGSPECASGLGGEDFHRVLMDYFMTEFKKANPEFESTPEFLVSQRQVTEKVMIKLSSTSKAEFILPAQPPSDWDLSPGSWPQGVSKEVHVKITRREFENLVKELIERIKNHCEKCLRKAGVTPKDVDVVLLVGGMARVPIVKKVITDVFGKMPKEGVNPEEAIALGAASAVQAGRCPSLVSIPPSINTLDSANHVSLSVFTLSPGLGRG